MIGLNQFRLMRCIRAPLRLIVAKNDSRLTE